LFVSQPAELLHGSLLIDLVLSFQATLSFFLAEKLALGSLWPGA
jgi:hypothetical protein